MSKPEALKCGECGRGSARCHGLCPRCNGRAMRGRPMKTAAGQARQAELKAFAEALSDQVAPGKAVRA